MCLAVQLTLQVCLTISGTKIVEEVLLDLQVEVMLDHQSDLQVDQGEVDLHVVVMVDQMDLGVLEVLGDLGVLGVLEALGDLADKEVVMVDQEVQRQVKATLDLGDRLGDHLGDLLGDHLGDHQGDLKELVEVKVDSLVAWEEQVLINTFSMFVNKGQVVVEVQAEVCHIYEGLVYFKLEIYCLTSR